MLRIWIDAVLMSHLHSPLMHRRAVPPHCCDIRFRSILDHSEAEEWRTSIQQLRDIEASGQAGYIEYSECMQLCRENGEWRVNIQLLHRARRREVTPLVDLYAQAIGACEDAGRVDDALQLYALALEDGAFKHWHADEPFSLDLHGFSQPCAAAAVRYVLQHELGNYIPSDLKIITGRGSHSEDGVSRLQPRIEQLLSQELEPPLKYDFSSRLSCDQSGCSWIANDGCLVVEVHDLFKWLVESKPFQSYYVSIPDGGMVSPKAA